LTATAILLLVAAALIHASWNLLSKRQSPSPAFFLAANTFGCLLLAPLVIVNATVYAEYPPQVWMLIGATGLCMAVYYAALAGAYRNGDMSVAYPLARSSPIIVVTIVTVFLGKGGQLSAQCVLGAVLVVAGCFLLPMRHFSDFRLKNYLNLTCAFALAAACGTAGYSIIDDEALRRLRNISAIPLGVSMITILYAFVEGISANLWLGVMIAVSPASRRELAQVLRESKLTCVLTGIGIYAAYILVLISMGFVKNISYVVAFRQLSIPLGALMGILVLREPRFPPKIAGVAVLCAGLVLVATG